MASVNLDVSQRLDITCRKGDTFSLTLNITDPEGNAITLAGYNFQMEVRDASSDSIIIPTTDFLFTKDANSTTGKLNITASAAIMNTSGTYVYDLESELISSSEIQTWLYGLFTINEDITA